MKRFKEIIQSTVEPSNTNVLWLNPDINELLYYSSNGWSPIYQDSSIIEPKSVRIERVETHIGKGAEYGDRSYFLYKANINPSSANVPYQISWGFNITDTVGYDKIAVDPKDNHYCKVFIDNVQPKDSGMLSATVTYGNKVIKGTTIVQYCSFLTINIESNLKGIDDFIFEHFGVSSIIIQDSNGGTYRITSGQYLPLSPNQQYRVYISEPIALLYDFIDPSEIDENENGIITGYWYDIVTPDIGSYLTKTIKCKARAVKVTSKYKDEIVTCMGVTPFIGNTYDDNSIIADSGDMGYQPDGTYISIRPYRFKDATLAVYPLVVEGTNQEETDIYFEDIVTNDFEDDYTEITLEGFVLEEREDVILSFNPVTGGGKNSRVCTKLMENSGSRSNYFFYTKEDVAKITDIGTWFKGSNIETFDQFQYFTGVTELQNMAFMSCNNLTSIIIPESVTVIPDQCFHSCHSLSNIILHDKIKTLGNYAFQACNLTSISLPNKLTSIGSDCFSMNSKLTDITIPNSVRTIGQNAFQYCSALSSISIPSSIKTINGSSFQNSGLTSITIPSSVTTIGSNAFQNCPNLTSVTIEGTSISIDSAAFSNCTKLSNLDVSKLSSSYYNYIGQEAFKNTSIQNLNLPGNPSIGENAFYNDNGNSKLETIIINGSSSTSQQTIERQAFAGHPNLKSITINHAYQDSKPGYSINVTAFYNAGSNGTIYVPSNTSGWETQGSIQYLLNSKGWTISYTL